MYVSPMPLDYATRQAVMLSAWPHMTVRKVYQRPKDLMNIVPHLSPFINDYPTTADLKALIKGLEAAERAEARRCFPKVQWRYDLVRHQQLRRHLAWERELLRQIEGSADTVRRELV